MRYNVPFKVKDVTKIQHAIHGKIYNLIFEVKHATGYSSWSKFMLLKLCLSHFFSSRVFFKDTDDSQHSL